MQSFLRPVLGLAGVLWLVSESLGVGDQKIPPVEGQISKGTSESSPDRLYRLALVSSELYIIN
jgi:hypothetical protein